MDIKEVKREFENKKAELDAIIEEAQTKIKEDSQSLLTSLFVDFFEKYSGLVRSVTWTQYTPYFNDGDECYFKVNDPDVTYFSKFTNEDEDDDEDEDNDLHSIIRNESYYRESLAQWVKFEIDPDAVYQEYLDWYKKTYPNPTRWNKPTEKSIYTPSYISKEVLEQRVAICNVVNEKYPNFLNDYKELKDFIASVSEYFEIVYGNHVKVTYRAPDATLEIEEYSHD